MDGSRRQKAVAAGVDTGYIQVEPVGTDTKSEGSESGDGTEGEAIMSSRVETVSHHVEAIVLSKEQRQTIEVSGPPDSTSTTYISSLS